MEEKVHGFFNDDGIPVNPNLTPKPSLCISCKKDSDSSQETLCALTRMDQQGAEDFKCDAYERKDNQFL